MSWIEDMNISKETLKIPTGLNLVQLEEYTAKIQRHKIEKWVTEVLYRKYLTQNTTVLSYFTAYFSHPSQTKDRISQFLRLSMNKVVCHPIMFVVGVYYLCNYLKVHKEKMTEKEFFLSYSICTGLASKTHEDRFFGNSYYHHWFNWDAENITLKQYTQNENAILNKLEFKLFIDYKNLKEFIKIHKV